jgi:hypothetical protein
VRGVEFCKRLLRHFPYGVFDSLTTKGDFEGLHGPTTISPTTKLLRSLPSTIEEGNEEKEKRTWSFIVQLLQYSVTAVFTLLCPLHCDTVTGLVAGSVEDAFVCPAESACVAEEVEPAAPWIDGSRKGILCRRRKIRR